MILRTYVVDGVPVKVSGKWTLQGIEGRAALPEIGLTGMPAVWDDPSYDLAHLGLHAVAQVAKPVFDPVTQSCEEVAPTFVDGMWTQSWQVAALTAAELEDRRVSMVPVQVTMRQARRALLNAGLLSQVNSAVANMAGVEGDAARIDWEFAADLKRTDSLVISIGGSLGLTSRQIDDLFTAAGDIQ